MCTVVLSSDRNNLRQDRDRRTSSNFLQACDLVPASSDASAEPNTCRGRDQQWTYPRLLLHDIACMRETRPCAAIRARDGITRRWAGEAHHPLLSLSLSPRSLTCFVCLPPSAFSVPSHHPRRHGARCTEVHAVCVSVLTLTFSFSSSFGMVVVTSRQTLYVSPWSHCLGAQLTRFSPQRWPVLPSGSLTVSVRVVLHWPH